MTHVSKKLADTVGSAIRGDDTAKFFQKLGMQIHGNLQTLTGSRSIGESTLSAGAVVHILGSVDPKYRGLNFLPPDTYQEYQTRYVHMPARWTMFGFPTFRVTKDLVTSLLLTECRGIRGRDLKFPFPTFFVELPQDPVILKTTDVAGTEVPVRWISVHNMHVPESDKNAKALAEIFDAETTAFHAGHSNAKQFQTAIVETERKSSLRGYTDLCLMSPTVDVDVSRAHLVPEDDESIEEWLEGTRNTRAEEFKLQPTDNNALMAAHRLIANLSLYLASNKTEWTVNKSRNRLKHGKGGISAPLVWDVGKAVKVPDHLVAAAQNFAVRGTNKAQWRVSSRFVVRGHWRDQVCGPGRSDRKRIWIQPHWKGPEAAAAITRLYEVTT